MEPVAKELTNGASSSSVDPHELQSKILRLEAENDSLKAELPMMEQAFNQAHEQNMRKVMEIASTEDRISRLQAEKSKADHKYFAAMKAKDQQTLELKTLKTQASKSSDIIARLHEADASTKMQVQNLEKQLELVEKSRDAYKLELSQLNSKLDQLSIRLDNYVRKANDALAKLAHKESELASSLNAKRTVEQELQELKVVNDRLSRTEAKGSKSLDSDQLEVYRVSDKSHTAKR